MRREELAQLAGVSAAYYTRLEQGDGGSMSAEILDAVARALRLSDAEHAHLIHLAKPMQHKKKPAAAPAQHVRLALQHLLDSIESVPAYVVRRRTDILAWNRMAAAVFGDWAQLPAQERNWSRLVFLHPESRDLYVDWEQKASDVVGYLRMDAGRHPDDPQLSALVGELSIKSAQFRQLWAAHDVKAKGNGTKQMRHPLVGELILSFETFTLADSKEQALITHHAEPGSPSTEALRLLASWGGRRHTDQIVDVSPVGLRGRYTGRISGWGARRRGAVPPRSASSCLPGFPGAPHEPLTISGRRRRAGSAGCGLTAPAVSATRCSRRPCASWKPAD